MKSSKIFMIMSVMAAGAMMGCKSQKADVVTTLRPVEANTIGSTEDLVKKYISGSWTVCTVGTQQVKGTDRPYVEFGESASNPFMVNCYAYDGCNYLNGTYAITPGGEMKRASDFISTMRMCDGAVYELGVIEALNNVDHYTITREASTMTMAMLAADSTKLMTLVRFQTEMINGAWNVTTIYGSSVDTDLGLCLVFDLTEQTVHGNVGCNTLNGKLRTNPDIANSLTLYDLITTRMTCPAIETEQKLLKALSDVVSIQPGQNSSAINLRNSDGVDVVVLRKADI
ncbi:MAG: META domain-containing protein [Bacteroides sp.]|nr:META domain-containing protein [Bacteroides sp.]